MPDIRILPRAALEDRRALVSAEISLTPLAEGCVIHVLARAGEHDLRAVLESAVPDESYAVRVSGPGQWFVISDEPLVRTRMAELMEMLRPRAAIVDQSHGRVRMRLEGRMAERVLSKGTAVDLDLSAFPVGHSATTLIGHVSAHLTRTGEQVFEIMVLRGFAESLFDDLSAMCAEFL
ncbi:MAG: sarcosine oxidase subunit gamma [Shinella sp.]|nr:sarcosine oxidase subunit gamma [Shinella sp.]